MKVLLGFLLLLLAFCGLYSCNPNEEQLTADPRVTLRFDRDTVIFDTVFVQTGSVTKRLWVHNTAAKAVNIERIELAHASGTQFSLIINGQQTSALSNFKLRGKDSLQILVKVTINPQASPQPFLVTDSIRFITNGNHQDVKLVAYGQNAYFHTTADSAIFQANCPLVTWTNEKPHVVYGTLIVPQGCTLRVEAGARIYCHANARLFVAGTLLVEGQATKRVRFQGDRLEPYYADVAGQWIGIIFLNGLSTTSSIQYTDILNAYYGVYIGSPEGQAGLDLKIENSLLANMVYNGLAAYNSTVNATNCIFANTGQPAVGCFIGGQYAFLHCTMANFSSSLTHKVPTAVFQARTELADGTIETAPLNLSFINNIIWGSLEDELYLDTEGNLPLTYTFQNNLIRTKEYKTFVAANGSNNQFSQLDNFPRFTQPYLYDLTIDSTNSPALHAGLELNIATDISGATRPMPAGTLPDAGAFEANQLP